jgi:putative hemolysin
MLVFELAIVLGLIVLNGFLAMSELALVSARRPLLEQMARHGSQRCQRRSTDATVVF